MSYKTYTTEAIVCGSYDRLTADRTYLLFTEEAGMVYATARSAREERSKQRYALQDFSHVRVSLVRGKSGWRVGSVEPLVNYYSLAATRELRGHVVAVVALLRRLLTGEDTQPAVFEDTRLLLMALPEQTTEVAAMLYDRYALRVLAHLGYIATNAAYTELLSAGDAWASDPEPLPAAAHTAITNGLQASHL